MKIYSTVFLGFLLSMFFVTVAGQNDVLLEDDVRVNNEQVSHHLTAKADLENVEVVDLYSSNVSDETTDFLGDRYSVIRKTIGDMEAGEKVMLNYSVEFADYALLGANTFRYNGERHRLSPERFEPEREGFSFKPFPLFVGILIAAGLLMYGRLSESAHD